MNKTTVEKAGERPGAKFALGQTMITPAALEVLTHGDVWTALGRHVTGDWGECDAEDAAENDLSVREGFRIFSVYRSAGGVKFWVITEADRSVTTVLLPEDY